MEDLDCAHNIVITQTNPCEYVQGCDFSYVNFYAFHYCYFDQQIWLTLPIFIIIGLICFYILSDTANKYLSVALTTLSDKFNISQNLAGVTLLAFGNGAPDVISSFVAAKDENGLNFTIASTAGAGIFLTAFVLSAVIYYARSVQVNFNLIVDESCNVFERYYFLLNCGEYSVNFRS
jgi:sodium/potassium/calcium exchanger 6